MNFQRGDLVALNFTPPSGHEQIKRRYAVVLSNDEFNRRCNLRIVCPISSNDDGFPLHVKIDGAVSDPAGYPSSITGFAQVEQAKSLDLDARDAEYAGKIADSKVKRMTELLLACLL
ncbi:hypothetical protein KIMH_14740 [Bombiscardovia apis]|uniref:Type II toxin-antitoxin system PemK/MazF family toxin n=1 Tax=Bombiscardovia apis TaxID=2932182 RepID=A0ABN6SJT0_9BIFI|nr:type II toxin-antitoxin system PemK/MazF family toxin [Bombiscardovia apis]BDR55363.1 hypothetical protein KIMH_14740 [Bombiscardovia apis]